MVFPIQGNQQFQEILDPFRIHLAHRFVEDEELRVRHKNGRQRKALPLSAGESVDAPIRHTRKTRLFERARHFPRNDRWIFSAVFESKSHFVPHRHRKELVIRRLIHRPCEQSDVFRAHFRHISSIERNRPSEDRFARLQ